MKHSKYILAFLLLVAAFGCENKEEKIFTKEDINIIPNPLFTKLNTGSFRFTNATKLVAETKEQQNLLRSFSI